VPWAAFVGGHGPDQVRALASVVRLLDPGCLERRTVPVCSEMDPRRAPSRRVCLARSSLGEDKC